MILETIAIIGLLIAAGGVIAAFVEWMKSDPHRDVVLFMGCKQTGKTESLSALRGEKFNPERQGSGLRIDIEKMSLCGQETPMGNKLITSIDSAGEDDHSKTTLIKASVKYLEDSKTEYFLLLLVVDLRKLDQETIDSTAERLALLAGDIENRYGNGSRCVNLKKRYDEGCCGYAIVGTHAKQAGAETNAAKLSQVARNFAKKKRKFRCLYENAVECFELSENKERERLCTWLMDTLKRLHE